MKAQVPLRFRTRSRELQAMLLQSPLLVETRLGPKRARAGWWLVFDERGRPYDVYAPGDFVTAFQPVNEAAARPYLQAREIPVTRKADPEERAAAAGLGITPAEFVADLDEALPGRIERLRQYEEAERISDLLRGDIVDGSPPDGVPTISAPSSWWDRLRAKLHFPTRLHVGGSW